MASGIFNGFIGTSGPIALNGDWPDISGRLEALLKVYLKNTQKSFIIIDRGTILDRFKAIYLHLKINATPTIFCEIISKPFALQATGNQLGTMCG